MICESISLWRKSSSPSLNAKEWEVSYGRGFIIEVNIQRRKEGRGLGKRITVLKTFLSLISFHQLWVTKGLKHIFLAYLKKGKALCSWQRRVPLLTPSATAFTDDNPLQPSSIRQVNLSQETYNIAKGWAYPTDRQLSFYFLNISKTNTK